MLYIFQCPYYGGNSAPFRTICVKDAISDLAEIESSEIPYINKRRDTINMKEEIPYTNEPISHFQRKVIIR